LQAPPRADYGAAMKRTSRKAAALRLHKDRLFPPGPAVRAIARRLYAAVKDLPILSPHGHCDPAWFADDAPFPDPARLFITPDHYIYRLLYSQGVPLEALGIPRRDGAPVEQDGRKIWRLFAEHYHLFRGTPTRLWLDHAFAAVFGLKTRLGPDTADRYYDRIDAALKTKAFRPRALFKRFNIEVLATTEAPSDPLAHHQALRRSGWKGRVITAFRPDPCVDPEFEGFAEHVARMGALAGEDVASYKGYVRALENRRRFFKSMGATSTDHGHPTAATFDIPEAEAASLYAKALHGRAAPHDAELFRGHMLMEMARMSREDGLVMQLHPGSFRNHNPALFRDFGRDKGADIPMPTDYVRALKPLLDKHGNARDLTLILFTLDETAYARELAPLAGHYPILRLGPAWWFFDSPEGMKRYRAWTSETAGFANTVGFNDDTRAFFSIPGRHDVARRVDCAYLAELVADHRLNEDEAHEVAADLAYNLAKRAYKL
jgi:glucuronate isomerase